MDPRPPRPCMLVVDDEDGPRTALRMVFKNQFSIYAFDNCADALEFVRDHVVHIAVLDLHIGRGCGLDLLRRIKELDPRIEVIMLTAQESLDSVKHAMRNGACDYLSKPFDLSTLREAVARAHRLRAIANNVESNTERLRTLTDQLHESFSREELTRTANEIYAGVIHDLNNPLAIISGYVDVLNQRIANATNLAGDHLEDFRQHLHTISKQVNTCCDISARYLRFMSRVGREPQQAPVNQVISEVEQLLRNHPALKNSLLVVDPLPEDAVAGLHGTELLQSLLNLAVNALQSSDAPQTIRISAEFYPRPLPVSTFVNGPEMHYSGVDSFNNTPPFVAISVADQGSGIPAHVLPRIFETYFTTKEPGKGTGLGLSIVARLVRSAHGFVRVNTRPGQGTVMTLILPAGPVPQATISEDPMAANGTPAVL